MLVKKGFSKLSVKVIRKHDAGEFQYDKKIHVSLCESRVIKCQHGFSVSGGKLCIVKSVIPGVDLVT